jgi:hypothetical protein
MGHSVPLLLWAIGLIGTWQMVQELGRGKSTMRPTTSSNSISGIEYASLHSRVASGSTMAAVFMHAPFNLDLCLAAHFDLAKNLASAV